MEIEDSFFSNDSNDSQAAVEKNEKEIDNNRRLIQGNEDFKKGIAPLNQAIEITKIKSPG